MSKSKSLAPGQERSVTVTLKSLRNPPLDIKLTSQPPNTSILDVKGQVSSQTRIPVEKMKVLHNKRPVQDSKVLKDLLGDEESSLEFSVMVIGGAAAILPEETDATATTSTTEAATAPAEETTAGIDELASKEFWSDLKGFLMQRLKSQELAEELSELFQSSWESSKSKP